MTRKSPCWIPSSVKDPSANGGGLKLGPPEGVPRLFGMRISCATRRSDSLGSTFERVAAFDDEFAGKLETRRGDDRNVLDVRVPNFDEHPSANASARGEHCVSACRCAGDVKESIWIGLTMRQAQVGIGCLRNRHDGGSGERLPIFRIDDAASNVPRRHDARANRDVDAADIGARGQRDR